MDGGFRPWPNLPTGPLAYTYDNDTMMTLQEKINITDFPAMFTHRKVDRTRKHNWHGIKPEHSKRYKMTKDRL